MTARELADILMKNPDAHVRLECEAQDGYTHEVRVVKGRVRGRPDVIYLRGSVDIIDPTDEWDDDE